MLPLRKQVAEEIANNNDWPHALNSSLIRLLDVPTLNLEANAYYELAPAIASLTDREIEECLKKPLVLHHPCHKQSVKRHVKLVAEEPAEVAGFDTEMESFAKKLNLANS